MLPQCIYLYPYLLQKLLKVSQRYKTGKDELQVFFKKLKQEEEHPLQSGMRYSMVMPLALDKPKGLSGRQWVYGEEIKSDTSMLHGIKND